MEYFDNNDIYSETFDWKLLDVLDTSANVSSSIFKFCTICWVCIKMSGPFFSLQKAMALVIIPSPHCEILTKVAATCLVRQLLK